MTPAELVRAGQLLAGKYRVERVLGQGGMGVVVAARHEQLNQLVAVKFLLPSALEREDALSRFLREARAAAQLRSEHVARVTDVGTLEFGAPYLVMELLHGVDLAQLLQLRGPLPLGEAIEYVLQAAEGVAEAHALGIVHRDLKTSNLFLTHRPDGSPLVKVLDFGISKSPVRSQANDTTTRTDHVLGSPPYMSPEQLRNFRDVDARADIWSLGVVLYELLTARYPHEADTLVDLMATILSAPPLPLTRVRSDVPWPVQEIIQHCLEKDRAARFGNVAELAAALAPFGTAAAAASAERVANIARTAGFPAGPRWQPGGGEASPPTLVLPSSGPVAWSQSEAPKQPSPARRLARPALLVLAALACAGALATLSVLFVRSRAAPPLADPSVTVAAEHGTPGTVVTPSAAASGASAEPMPAPQTAPSASMAAPAASMAASSTPAGSAAPAASHPAAAASSLRRAPARDDIFAKRKW